MNAFSRSFEFDERNLLAAVQFVDGVTRLPVLCRVKVRADGLRILEKRNGQVLVLAKDDVADLAMVSTSCAITCLPQDTAYLPRKAKISIPRKNDGTAASLFLPITIVLYPSVSYRCSGNLGGLLVTVSDAQGKRVRGAVVTLTPDGNSNLASRSVSNAAGEALLLVSGAAVVHYAAGTHSENIKATVERLFDDDAKTRVENTPEAIAAARAETFVTNPDDLLADAALIPRSDAVTFRAGRIQAWPPP